MPAFLHHSLDTAWKTFQISPQEHLKSAFVESYVARGLYIVHFIYSKCNKCKIDFFLMWLICYIFFYDFIMINSLYSIDLT